MVLLLESVESPVDLVEVPEHVASELGELAAHLVEPAVDLGELASEEFGELLVLGRGHDPCVSQFRAAVKCVQFWTARLAYDDGGPGEVGNGTLWVGGKKVAEKRIPRTIMQPYFTFGRSIC